jgi:hypothetical protein
MALDAQAIARIIDAVEASAGRKFSDIDRAALQKDVEFAQLYHEEMRILGDRTRGRKVDQKVKQIRRSAQQILDKMDADACQWLDCMAGGIDQFNVWREDSEDIRRAVQHLIKLIDYEPPPNARTPDPERLLGWPGSPFERIAGRYLRKVFENHFETEAGYRADPDKGKVVRGPYIDFAELALIELEILNKGKAYTRKSIADALTDTRKQEAGKFGSSKKSAV